MAANNSISLVNLDFDTFKEQLKTYLRGQAQFSDYDFDGSNMSVLLDILSYNTHLNAFYLNMVASEMFLDSAQLRNSVISIAKSLNYTPRSTKSAKAILNLQFAQSGLQTFFIPAGTRFSGKNSRGTFQFLTQDSLFLSPSNGSFTANNVTVFEGVLTTETFVTNYAIEAQRFILNNNTIDTDSLTVFVSEDGGLTNTTFVKSTSLYDVSRTSEIFFVQATDDTRYEIVFGDGVLGRRPKDGSIITCTYRNTSGSLGNEASNFILNDNLGAVNGVGSAITPTITVVSTGFGGGESETIEDIRFRAPKFYQTQERAITTNDFQALVTQQFQYIKNLYVYGGDQDATPKFGTVFIAPITFTGDLLSLAEKAEIENFISDKTTLGIVPKVIDPDFLFINTNTTIKVDLARSSLTSAELVTIVKQAISEYNDVELTDFNKEFRMSRFESAVNDSDPAILSNTTDITIRKTFTAEIFQRTFPIINYRNSIVPGSVISSPFASQGKRYQYTDFNPNSSSFIVQQIDGKTVITNTSRILYLKDVTIPDITSYTPAGTVDYEKGVLTVNAIVITSFLGRTGLDFTAKSVTEDVLSKNNDVLTIDEESGVTVTVARVN